MSDGTVVEIRVKSDGSAGSMPWVMFVDGTEVMRFKTKAEAAVYARDFARDLRESEGSNGNVVIEEE